MTPTHRSDPRFGDGVATGDNGNSPMRRPPGRRRRATEARPARWLRAILGIGPVLAAQYVEEEVAAVTARILQRSKQREHGSVLTRAARHTRREGTHSSVGSPLRTARLFGGDGRGGEGRASDVESAARTELSRKLRGALLLPDDDGFELAGSGYNSALRHRPAVVVRATGVADVLAAVGFASERGLPIGVLNTGHSASVAADGAMLINTADMIGARIDPITRTARIDAGTSWRQVVHESAPFGLAPLSGSSSSVGAVGYTLGGGLGLLGREFGYAADHVRSIDVVTAGARLRRVDPDRDQDLFWALRGGKGNFGVVTSMEVDLFGVDELFGGGLFFRGSDAREVLHAYRKWVRGLPERTTSSVALIRFPWGGDVAEELRGRFVVHVRIAHNGSEAEGRRLVRPLRDAAVPVRDTLSRLPYTETDAIHRDPTEGFDMRESTACLRDLDEAAVEELLHVAGPDSTCPMRLVEVRHLGGALAREPAVANAVGNRDAGFLLYTAGVGGGPEADQVAECSREIMEKMRRFTTGGVLLNFLGVDHADPDQVRAAYDATAHDMLRSVKHEHDPDNLFRINHNILPAPR